MCARVQALLPSETFRVYASQDVYGVELAGALKNIYAIKGDALGVYLPLVQGLKRILFEDANTGEVVSSLMTSEQGRDVEFAAPSEWQSV